MKANPLDVVLGGGGAAGIGVAVALRDAGVKAPLTFERNRVGSSFAAWHAETRFITPSFATNSVGMLDLNSIALGTSPAFGLRVEHPTGRQYASHLKDIVKFAELPVREKITVLRITKVGDDFWIDTADETLRAKNVVWAAGEYQYLRFTGFDGSDLCCHTATIPSFRELDGNDFIIIGGYESGVDAAYHLASVGKRARLFDSGCPWDESTSDPSVALSTYSLERMRESSLSESVELFLNTPVRSVSRTDGGFQVTTKDNRRFHTPVPPLLAGGFIGSHKLVIELFEPREDGFPLLNQNDESTVVPGMYLCGPAVRHDNHVFCFIYKYRQRFAVVAKAIATSPGLPAERLEEYRNWGMYLDDLSCCGEECVC